MKFCENCILPDTRPGITIQDNGICNACQGHKEKDCSIDWGKREELFNIIIDETKALNRPFDCVVPVSGGKDSTYQVAKCLELGLKVLAVTWRTPGRTKIGQKNLDNLISLGVDHIDYSLNPHVERKLTYKTLCEAGSIGVAMHLALFIIPMRIATSMNIPLIVWGESPFMEYGGEKTQRDDFYMSHTFLKTHGILQGKLAEDWLDKDISEADLEILRLPSEEEFSRIKLRSIFLGYFFNWSPQESLRVASEKGFKAREEGPKVGYYNYADIDCDFISVHHWFKWLKFGFTRTFDNLSIEIRNGLMTRRKALEIIKQRGNERPHEDIAKLCAFLKIPESHFEEIEEKFRNRDVWSREDGRWVITDFPIKDFYWA